MYQNLKIGNFLIIFIGITCVIGCRNADVRKNDIKSIDSKKTDAKNSSKQSDLYDETGIASFISDEYDGKMTASGVRYDKNKLTAAHPSLSFGTKILITNLMNKRKVEVIVIDRFYRTTDRIVNVSHRAGVELDLIESGIAKVGITIIEKTGQNFK
ncbi:MAG: septal ring lytic transglycosylase RlpA family protein [Candidatus Brocadia sp. AMX2]|uniref:Lipoproteins n=1 Tax=Candidatus Brocadia sinica JPN1 TaxID=1197129 RepID=A0ABQ0JWW2_9BACT|nr:MAG: septal ring lytic transglycosylase RlpA family protein [Candidatus Brocadia sp. AMX2]KXK29560.1 MAG: RlpA-like protein precursor [Candidatus Brocadia sinica]MBC6931119.1 septal ring lytic transglycosylase RlpA family protein [Candidatus Brocadia sp.]MBL1167482.1 septal ring lytic transglycosylase RlpA family protein [Candidatus Brocadia sp. AMX1]GAN33137.1 lipoproteins [Candidatus Brocadia sinica JPN1]